MRGGSAGHARVKAQGNGPEHTGLGTGGDAPFEMVSAGDHCAFRMSKQIDPLLFTFGWYMRVVKETFGGLKG